MSEYTKHIQWIVAKVEDSFKDAFKSFAILTCCESTKDVISSVYY